ncbi:protein LURP-one-related 4-like, partial [Quercus lobata]|uniref:protein LURP-one-related 4-like n=1 Tax=Quercus lobata TaxID=97700 RepID=UPI001247A47B
CFNASSSSYITSKREAFTIWMKSLVILQGNGCTVFNENGEIVYRIDNYDKKCSNKLNLMDLQGNVLFTILRKVRYLKLHIWVFRRWDLYKCNNASMYNKGEPLFQVRKIYRVPKGDVSYQVTMLSEKAQASCYMLEISTGELAFKITDSMGELVAEARQKHSFSGVGLGYDVLTLMVVSHVDHSIVMALVTVYGLMQCRM